MRPPTRPAAHVIHGSRRWLPIAIGLGLLTGCGVSEPLQPRAVSVVEGRSGTPEPSMPMAPLVHKVIFAVSLSPTWEVTDPRAQRAQAMESYITELALDPSAEVAVMLFSDPASVWLTHGGAEGFVKASALSSVAIEDLGGQMLAYSFPSNSQSREQVDFVKPLNLVTQAIVDDLAQIGGEPQRVEYTVYFVVDSGPTSPEDPQIDAACQELASLQGGDTRDRLNTVRIFEPVIPPQESSSLEAALMANAQRLTTMARIGRGQFFDFEESATLTFDGD